jgi:long-subunit fatty acid transport protein
MLWLTTLGLAYASGFDALEVAGPWGTPTTTEPPALWWNPGALAAGKGHRIFVEGAPTFAATDFERANPNGGSDRILTRGTIPFVAVASDLTVDGLAVAIGMAIPIARPGEEETPPGSGHYHLRKGELSAMHLMVGAGYDIADKVSLGAAVHVVESSWEADLDFDALPDLVDAMEEEGIDDVDGLEIEYTDDDLERSDYATRLEFPHLKDRTVTWSIGAYVHPIEMLAIGISFIAPYSVDNTGSATLTFSCPDQEDVVGRYGAEAFGICRANGVPVSLAADGRVAYSLPSRLHYGVRVQPIEPLLLQIMGGVVAYKTLADFDIEVTNVSERNTFDSDLQRERTPALTEQHVLWARELKNSWFLGLDAKGTVNKYLMLGGRFLFDKSAIPDEALSTNNYDADTFSLSGVAAVSPVPQLRIGLSYTEQILAERVVTTSGYKMTLDDSQRVEARWFYPQMNGTYKSAIHRMGVSVLAAF